MTAITLQNLTRRFSGNKKQPNFTAVDGLNFTVETGEVFGFLGPNGAGKTTTVRMLTALIAPSDGTATVNGHALGAENTAIRQDVGILTESPGLYDNLSARQNLRFFADLYAVENPDSQVEKYLWQFNLFDRADDIAGTFSKGMKQKLALARALLHEPPIIFLDEPTSGLDPSAAKTVREAIETLSGQGRTIFLCTHNLDEAEKLCDRIGVLNEGKLVALDTPAALRNQLFGQSTLVRIENLSAEMVAAVETLPFVTQTFADGNALRVSLDDAASHTPDLVSALVGFGARIQYVSEQTHSLEDVYLSLVGGEA